MTAPLYARVVWVVVQDHRQTVALLDPASDLCLGEDFLRDDEAVTMIIAHLRVV
jgi:hypothetical protein